MDVLDDHKTSGLLFYTDLRYEESEVEGIAQLVTFE